jgi:hypothetical protein
LSSLAIAAELPLNAFGFGIKKKPKEKAIVSRFIKAGHFFRGFGQETQNMVEYTVLV